MTEKNIGIGGINVLPGRLRALRPTVVKALVESIQVGGLTNAITVRPRDSGGYWLIAGLHRFTACKKLKEKTIRATVLTGLTENQAKLIEIDENLVRADLSPVERKISIGERARIWELEYGKAKAVGARAANKKMGRGDATAPGADASFVSDTAKKVGHSKRAVRRDVQHAKEVKVLKQIARTSLDNETEIRALLQLPAKERDALIERARAGEKVSAKTRLKQIKRDEREKELGSKQIALPDKKYGVIVCDDAWDFEVWSRETGMDRHAANHYVVEDAHTAAEMHEVTKDRFKCAADDCLLAMWTTVPHLAIAIDLLRMRDFGYVSHYVWGKNKAGTGHWNRNKHELLLLGVRGKIPCPAPGKQWDSLIMAPVGKHSAKPEKFLKMLEEYFPNLPKIELNRRGKPRPGWAAWGNEAELQGAAE